jgi:diguanylate cyclase (GGDEF)-like protein
VGFINANADAFIRFDAYVDVAIDIALGYSMVVVLMEDAKREIDDAQTQLRVTHDQLRRAALYDTMTDSLNRQAFAEGVGLEMVRATFGTVVLADLDNLKTVNDRFGHAAGDRLLRRCADVIRATLRPYDKLYRWGGDEFLLIVPSARSSDVMKRLHEALAAAEPITLESDMPLADLRLQVSLGASDYSSSEELHFAIERADRAMYQDKTRRKTDPRGYARVLDTPVSLPIVQS